MPQDFYIPSKAKICPGDIFDSLPYARIPKPLRVAKKITVGLPPRVQAKVRGELREILDVTIQDSNTGFDFLGQGEEILSRAKISRAIFLTWGSEVDADTGGGKLDSKDWLIAPLFPLKDQEGRTIKNRSTGEIINFAEAIKTGKSPRYFPLQAIPGEEGDLYYVDFKKVCPLAASHCIDLPRKWQLAAPALNDFYSHFLWFFTRKKIFFAPISCTGCGREVDLGVTFEGQPLDAEGDGGI